MKADKAEHVCTVVASDWASWARLAGSWRDVERDAMPAFFVTYEWLDAYWRTQGTGHTPYVIAIHDTSGHLVGYAPFEVVRRRVLARWPVAITCLRFPCRREREGLEFLARIGHEVAVANAVAEHLRQRQSPWHEVLLTDAPLEGVVVEAFRRAFESDVGHRVTVMPRPATPIIVLTGTWEAWIASLPGKRRRETLRSWRRLDDLGAKLRLLEHPDDLHEALEFLFSMKNARLQEVASGSVYERPEVRDYLRIGASGMLRSNTLECVVIEIEGSLAAVELDFRIGNRMWAFINAFDPRWRTLGLGLRLLEHAMQRGMASGAHELVLGQGDPGFKADFATELRDNVDLRIERRWIARVVGTVDRLRGIAGRAR